MDEAGDVGGERSDDAAVDPRRKAPLPPTPLPTPLPAKGEGERRELRLNSRGRGPGFRFGRGEPGPPSPGSGDGGGREGRKGEEVGGGGGGGRRWEEEGKRGKQLTEWFKVKRGNISSFDQLLIGLLAQKSESSDKYFVLFRSFTSGSKIGRKINQK